MRHASTPTFVALILAADRGWRMGGPKALMTVDDRPWWEIQNTALNTAGVRPLWVVSREVFAAMGSSAPRVVIADADAPIFQSVQTGLTALQSEPVDGVFVLPIDVPVPGKPVWDAVAAKALVESVPAAPIHAGLHGHPVFMPWRWAEAHVLWAPSGGQLDESMRDVVQYVEAEDVATVTNLNTPDEVRGWLTR
jgi:CTP:molybdopterin cytidylyltransferase MocA